MNTLLISPASSSNRYLSGIPFISPRFHSTNLSSSHSLLRSARATPDELHTQTETVDDEEPKLESNANVGSTSTSSALIDKELKKAGFS